MKNTILSKMLAGITHFFALLFGKLIWNKPVWINFLNNQRIKKPKWFFGCLVGIIILIATSLYVYAWYQALPKPERIIAQITPPKLTSVDDVLIPGVLRINFGVVAGGELNARSVAPLNLIDKEITKGITMTPMIPGKWTWESDSLLIFTPETDWPAGQTYNIQFSNDFFAKNSNVASLQDSFTTLSFDAVISEFKFYQDPTNPSLRQTVATINFSHPVDTTSLENKIQLMYQALKNGKQDLNAESVNYTIDYDKNKRTAYIHSEPLSLPQTERYMELILGKGIKPIAGPSVIKEKIKATVIIPDVESFFKVNKTDASIVRDQQDKPEQVLTLETTVGVTQDELRKSLHVYLLPPDYPATAAEEAKLNYEWKDPGEVTSNILTLAKPLELQEIPTEQDYATLHSYQFQATAPSYIYLKLDKGTHAFADFALANDYVAIIKVPEYPQEISFLHKGALLALGTEEKLSVLVRGLGAVKFEIARVLPNDINHLVTQTGGDFNDPYFIDPNFNQDNISEIFSHIQQFDVTDPAKAQYTALDLSQYLTAKKHETPLGLFLLQARSWDTKKNIPLDTQTRRLILITDLGLIVKDNNNGTHDMFVQSITTGLPVKNASVAILGKNGVPLLTRTTDDQGRANFPTLNDFINDKEPAVYLVRNGHDVSFIPYNRADRQLNYSRFDIGGIANNNDNQTALTAYVFSDRGIYRPGDGGHIGMIVKQSYVLPQPAGLPLEATIIDPRGAIVKNEKIILNESGYLTLDFQTDPTSPTGQYYVNLNIVKDNHPSSLIGSMSFHVAEFLPDRMRISTLLSQEQTPGWISPTKLTAKVGLWNLYGAPATGRRISAKILLTPRAVTFKTFPDYIFIDPLLDPKKPPKVFTDTLTDINTNEQGQAEFNLKLERFEKATYELTVFTEGFEAEGGRSVTKQTTALVSPLSYFVGYKADGDLNYIKQNAARNVNIIAVNPQLKQQALSNLKIKLYRLHPITTLVKRDDGTYQYQSMIQSTEISSEPFSIPEQGINYALRAEQIGDFLITILDANGTELSRFNYSIVGTSQQPLPQNAELSVKVNKSEFDAGEDIEMQITAPYIGAGLITIERDKVYATQWFKTTTTASVQKIHIPKDFQGDGYVNIAFVRDLNSPEIFMSPLSYTVLPFSVSHKNHEIKIDLSTQALALPDQPLVITYKTDKPSKIIVFAIDEGILQVSNYLTPDPLKFFFQKHSLLVTTQQIVDQILPKFMADRELSAVGGDNGEAALNKNLNPFKRKTDAPVVYWSGIIDADETPRQVTYHIPDYFNGAIRTMAVAVAADAVGSAATSTEVRGHFAINPNTPTFIAPGDRFEITASIANNVKESGKNANVSVELTTTPGLEIIESEKETLNIPEGQERSVHFKLHAKPVLGSAEVKLIATLGDKSSKMSSTVSIRPPIAYSTNILSGYSTDANKKLPLNRILYPEYRQVEVAVSPSPLILVMGLQRYLNEYPYGCTEQLVSKAFPLLAMANQAQFIDDAKTINDRIQQTIQMLGQRQMSSGGFNYWPETGTTENNIFASVYAMHFLTEAKAQGHAVPSDLFSAGIGFLKDLASQPSIADVEQAQIRAYAIYILTCNEIVTTNYLTNLQLTLDQQYGNKWHGSITSAYLAATYQLLKNTSDAERMIGYYHIDSTEKTSQSSAFDDFYNPMTTDAQYFYLVAKHFPDHLQKMDTKLIARLVDALSDQYIDTIISGYASLALSAYSPFYNAANETTISITELLTNDKENTLSSSNGLYQKANIDIATKQIVLKNPDKKPYFYQLVQAGFDKNLPKNAVHQHIEVFREYRNEDNSVISDVSLGGEITVHIQLRSLDNQYYNNIAIVDLLPGGFEVVRNSINLQNIDYADTREDRVIFFGSVGPEAKEITYRIKATNIGTYIVPPIFAKSMYNPLIKSIGLTGTIKVTAS